LRAKRAHLKGKYEKRESAREKEEERRGKRHERRERKKISSPYPTDCDGTQTSSTFHTVHQSLSQYDLTERKQALRQQ
jgi:hypothetical protein